VRAAMVLAAVWFAAFALPLLLTAPTAGTARDDTRVGLVGAYRKLFSEVRSEWRRDRNVVAYLVASAVFRDGLTGVYTFGAVLGVSVYGISEADILLFGVSASVVAAIGAVTGGLLDDRFGSKAVIVGALTAMIASALTLLVVSGPSMFWVFGLMLCLFIGPTQASARTLMLRMAADGKEGVAFGLYTTVGRAVSFLAPWLFFLFIDIFGTDRAGMGGLIVVLVAGLALMIGVRAPHQRARVS
jgi:MFS transporter, UMF1 family